MAKSTLRYGSSGDEVKELQGLLNGAGYSLSTDGVYGEKTQSAVYDYQRKNGLAADGIAGVNTWGSLTGGSGASTEAATAATAAQTASPQQSVKSTFTTTGTRPSYEKSEDVKAAESALGSWEGQKPSQYTGTYSSQIDSLLEKVLNGEKFNYDMNADALYQQYREQYINGGKRAMEDTAAKSAEYTGGYGSSYGTTASAEAYQSYLNALNDKVPELEERAYNRYNNDKNLDTQNLSVLQGLDATEYGRYRDDVSDYWTEGNYLSDKAKTLSDDEYNKYLQLVNNYEADRRFDYSNYRDDLSQSNYEAELAYQKERDAVSDAQWQKEYELSASSRSSSGGSSSGRSGSESSSIPSDISKALENCSSNDELENKIGQYQASGLLNDAQANNAWTTYSKEEIPTTYKEFVNATGNSGIMTENEFRSRGAKSKYKSYTDYLETMYNKYK